MPITVPVIIRNHFDPTWRRAFRVPITYQGVTVGSYAQVEERVIDGWLAMVAHGATFSESQTAVWREYLRRHPERIGALRQAVAEGRLCVQLGGETVQDSNLPAAEGLIRNFLVAMPLYRDLCGSDHEGLEIAWLEDAFGNSANYPQVLAGCGAKTVSRMSYRSLPDPVWTGIDGTRLPVLDVRPAHGVFPVIKHPPCAACAGAGCSACDGSGIRWMDMYSQRDVEEAIERAIADDRAARAGIQRSGASATERLDGLGQAVVGGLPLQDGVCGWHVAIGGEEVLHDRRVLAAVSAVAARHPDYVPRFATMLDLWRADRRALLERAERSAHGPSPDLNPAMPGCMVTRHGLKTRVRGLAHRLCVAEARIANDQWSADAPAKLPHEMQTAWQQVCFGQFHDAITGTLLDGAAAELHGMLDEASTVLDRLGSNAEAANPPRLRFAEPAVASGTKRWGDLEVDFDVRGVTAIRHGGRTLCAMRQVHATREPVRIGELGLEPDEGDAWGTRIDPLGHHAFVPLSDYHRGVSVADDALRWSGIYTGGDRRVRALSWTVTATPARGGQGVDFTVEIDWDAESRRIRLWVPVEGRHQSATYEIPFGHIERRFDPASFNYTLWTAHHNEFPMHHWIRAATEGGGHVALLAADLPCARWMPGWLDLSLLRSPQSPFCQVEQGFYEFWDNDGMRDAGRHRFAIGLMASAQDLPASRLSRIGYDRARAGFPALPFIVSGEVQVTAWKPAEDGQGWILRCYDSSGQGGPVTLEFPSERTVTPCDHLERPGQVGSIGAPGHGRRWTAVLRPHGIATLRIR